MTIQYSNSKEMLQPNFLKEWKAFTVTDDVQSWESADETKKRLVAMVDRWHNEFSMGSSVTVNPEYAHHLTPPIIDLSYEREKERVEKLIDDCTTKQEVEKYMMDAVKYKIVPHYNQKLNELQS